MHRDLKPANVKIAEDDRVKVLDFGLAKIHTPAEGTANQEKSPTLSEMLTVGGVVFGTAPYMSPEQARGKMVDRRTDIWAFGCILYEMLSGRQAFPSGETASDTLGWRARPRARLDRAAGGDSRLALRVLIERCLRKDPRHRLRDIGDALPDLQDIAGRRNPECRTSVRSAAPEQARVGDSRNRGRSRSLPSRRLLYDASLYRTRA